MLSQTERLPLEPWHDAGDGITGAYEGWFKNPDGSFSFLLGYFNRNLKEALDIPIGPKNRIEPGGPDRGQPTHFLPGRGWGIFTIVVPKDFGSDTKLIWTIEANGQIAEIPISLNPLWEIDPFSEIGIGNTPPVISFGPDGPSVQGPRPFDHSISATVANPNPLTVWVADDAKVAQGAQAPKTPPVTISWSKYRGPGEVTFSESNPAVEKLSVNKAAAHFNGKATTTASFSQPGDYVLLVVANDWSGEGGRGFQCCWTAARLKVSVAPQSSH
jgi:hypothetical protein